MYSRQHWREQEDVDRLPQGMVRTAYDADSRQYTFRDTPSGKNYVSAPGEAYGTLVPKATATFPRASRSSGRRTTLQAYDRPVIFADDMGHKRAPTMLPSSTRLHRSATSAGSTHKQGRKRSASFSDFLPPHLIARASTSPDAPPPPAKPRYAGTRGPSVRSAPPSPPPPPYVDEKKWSEWSSSPTDTKVSSLPTLPAVPPPLPPKDYPVSRSRQQQQQQQQSGGTWAPHVAMRLTARVFGRTLGASKSNQRPREGPPRDNGWVVV